VASIKRKTVRGKAAPHVADCNPVGIPASILQFHSDVTLCIDFFYVQGQVFLHVISRKIQHRVVIAVPDCSKKHMIKHLDSVFQIYRNRGFHIREVHADVEFECLRQHIAPAILNIVASDSHVGEVERSIRTIKERNRATVHGLPHKRLPKLLVREVVRHSVTCLNQIPADNGVSDTMSPNTIMTGRPNPDYNLMTLEFGSYVQIYEPTMFAMNTLRSRTTGAITLTHNGNAQGDYHFLSLISGRRVSRHQWTMLPITEGAIARVEQLAAEEGQPWVQSTGLLVEWRPEHPFKDDDDPDFVYTPKVDDDDYEDELYLWNDGISEEDVTVATNNRTDGEESNDVQSTNEHSVEYDADLSTVTEEEIESSDGDTSVQPDVMDEPESDLESEVEDDTPSPEQNVTPHSLRYNLRPARGRDYSHRLDHKMDSQTNSKSYIANVQLLQRKVRSVLTAYVLTQMSAAKGIKLFGQPAIEAVLTEFCQLHDMDVFDPMLASALTRAQKKLALRAVNLIKQKNRE
jgi:hypothetical protein